ATGCIINIILDPILIFGLLGFPAMGVRGAAIATVIGQIGAFLLYVVVYLHRNPGVTIHPRYLKKDWQLIRKIYSVGIPSSMMLMMPSAGQCAEWHSRGIFSGLCGGAWNLFQTADLYLYAGKRNDPGHAADHRLQLRRRTV